MRKLGKVTTRRRDKRKPFDRSVAAVVDPEKERVAQAVKRLDKIHGRVFTILEKHPKSRDNDTLLCWYYAMDYLKIELPFVEFEKLRALSFDSIARARRDIQNTLGRFLPTDPEVAKFRREKSIAMKQRYARG